MIKLRDFLKIANDPVIIKDGISEVLIISDDWFENDILSENLLGMEVSTVDAEAHRLVVRLKMER